MISTLKLGEQARPRCLPQRPQTWQVKPKPNNSNQLNQSNPKINLTIDFARIYSSTNNFREAPFLNFLPKRSNVEKKCSKSSWHAFTVYSLIFFYQFSSPNYWSRAMICGNYKSEAEIVIPATMLLPKRPLQRIETHEDCRQPEAAQQMYWTTCKRNNFFYRIHVRSLVYPC